MEAKAVLLDLELMKRLGSMPFALEYDNVAVVKRFSAKEEDFPT